MLPNLRILRKKQGISQQTLADELGVSQQSINQYENHSVEPDIAMLSKMADYFHTSIDFLVGRSEKKLENSFTVSLNAHDSQLLEKYHSLKLIEQECVDVVIDTLYNKE